jgi:CheY-like chemotaxis protein
MARKPKSRLSLVKHIGQTRACSEMTGSQQILVVEDNEVLRRLFISQLRMLGLSGHVADTGQEAVEAAANNDYGLILMDISMPVMNGLEATKLIRQNEKENGRPRAFIVAVTGSAQRDICIESGMDDFMTKPFLLDHLRLIINRWSQQRSSE